MLRKADKNKTRKKRHLRVRNRISGTSLRPRLNVFRSLANIYAQLIDDVKGVTLVAASSKEKGFQGSGGNKKKLGRLLQKFKFSDILFMQNFLISYKKAA